MKSVLLFRFLFVIGSKQLACLGNPDALVMLQKHVQSDASKVEAKTNVESMTEDPENEAANVVEEAEAAALEVQASAREDDAAAVSAAASVAEAKANVESMPEGPEKEAAEVAVAQEEAEAAALEVQASAAKDGAAALSAAANVAEAKANVESMPEGPEKEAATVAVAQEEAEAAALEVQASAAKEGAAAVSAVAGVAEATAHVGSMPEGLDKEQAQIAVAQGEYEAAALEVQASAARDDAALVRAAASVAEAKVESMPEGPEKDAAEAVVRQDNAKASAVDMQASAATAGAAAVSAAANVAAAKANVESMPEGLEKEAAKVAVAQEEARAVALEVQASAAKDDVAAVIAAASVAAARADVESMPEGPEKEAAEVAVAQREGEAAALEVQASGAHAAAAAVSAAERLAEAKANLESMPEGPEKETARDAVAQEEANSAELDEQASAAKVATAKADVESMPEGPEKEAAQAAVAQEEANSAELDVQTSAANDPLADVSAAASVAEAKSQAESMSEGPKNEAANVVVAQKEAEGLCALGHAKNMCDAWRKAGKGCHERWDKVCPGVEHPWGRNDVTPKETCGYCAWANPNKSTLQRSLTEVREKDLCVLGQNKRQMCNAWLRMGKRCNESWDEVCPGVEHPWGSNANHITPMDGCGYCAWAKKKTTQKAVLLQTLSKETPVEPELQTQENAATLDEAGYQAVASRKSNAEMNSFIRQVIMAHGGKITDKDKFQGVVPNYSGVEGASHYQRLLKELKHADWIEKADWTDVSSNAVEKEEQKEDKEEKVNKKKKKEGANKKKHNNPEEVQSDDKPEGKGVLSWLR